MGSVICLGETMAMMTATDGAALDTATTMRLSVGGAESNVALGLAAMGNDVEWIGRLGNDDFGQRISNELSAGGVGVDLVEFDKQLNTGLYVKVPEHGDLPASVIYYRAGSAASAMSPDFLLDPQRAKAIRNAPLIHMSGITPALSASCVAMMRTLLQLPRTGSACFDVNWRAPLWESQNPKVLLELGNLADIVLVGLDEASDAFGISSVDEIRGLFPKPATLLIKNESTSTVCFSGTTRTEVPALKVDVVEPVGAGDSFAAGYLSGVLAHENARTAMRRGHLAAACTLVVREDRGNLPDAADLETLLAVDDTQWERLKVNAGGIYHGTNHYSFGDPS